MTRESRRLHLGCGVNTPEGWIHLDGSWNAWLAKYPTWRKVLKAIRLLPAVREDIAWNPDLIIHDLRKALPFPDDHFAAIYASHLLEHLYLEEARALLQECVRVLIPGGILRMVVPDLRSIISEYMGERPSGQGSGNGEANHRADRLNKRLMFRSREPGSGNIFLKIYSSLKDLHSHKWMYDADSLIFYFQQAGLVNVGEMEYLQSQIAGIGEIEKGESILNGEGICVEGWKAG